MLDREHCLLSIYKNTYVGVDKVGSKGGTALELGVGNADAGVDNVGSHARSSRGVEDVVLTTNGLVGETDQARGGIGLGNEGGGLDLGVGLDVSNLLGVEDALDHVVVGIEGHGAPGVHLEGVDLGGQQVAEAVTLSEVALGDGGSKLSLLSRDGFIAEGVVVDDNVAARDDVLGVRVDDDAHEMGQVKSGMGLCLRAQRLTVVERHSPRQRGHDHQKICEHGVEGRHCD